MRQKVYPTVLESELYATGLLKSMPIIVLRLLLQGRRVNGT